MKGYRKYFTKKIIWALITLVVAVTLNFFLPRMMPGDPVATLTSKIAQGMSEPTAIKRVYDYYNTLFGQDKSKMEQFAIYIGNLLHGDLGISFSQYPRTISNILANALPWTIALQFPAIVIGWILGNLLGAIAAYIRKGFDKLVLPLFLFLSGIPAFGMAIVLLSVFAISLKWAPVSGGYGFNLIPSLSWSFFQSMLQHYWLPFLSIVIISIGGQAIGMRSMSIYELNADYVKYSRYMGIKDSKIVRYVFRNAMLPQVTGLAMSLGTMVGGALVAEMIFSYPGLGSVMLQGLSQADYPLISATTLIITIMVLIAAFLLDIIYGFIDPRVKANIFD